MTTPGRYVYNCHLCAGPIDGRLPHVKNLRHVEQESYDDHGRQTATVLSSEVVSTEHDGPCP